MLLRLSTRAGLRPLSIFTSKELKDKFDRAIANALSSESATNVSIRVKISDLLLYTLSFALPGVF